MYITEQQAREIAELVVRDHEMTPLTHKQKYQRVLEYAWDDYGILCTKPQALYIVKLVNLAWYIISASVQSEQRRLTAVHVQKNLPDLGETQ